MPPKGLMLIRGQIDLDIDRCMKKLREGLGERLEFGGGPFSIPHEQRMAAAIVRLRLHPGEARMIVHEATLVYDPEHGVPLFHDGSNISLREVLRKAHSS